MTTKQKITSEKPISIYPLSFDEALKVLVNVPSKEEKKDVKH